MQLKINANIYDNFSKVGLKILFYPLFIIFALVLFLYANQSLSEQGYVDIQRNFFLKINKILSQYPDLQHNITQFGDALIILSIFSILIYYTPKFWEALISASLLSLIFSGGLKNLIDVPRPAMIFDADSFTIIGNKVLGYSSCPSGHSITVFTTLTVFMFAFLPKKKVYKLLWCLGLLVLALCFAFSRVAVGAHHPFDVIIGSAIGAITGIIGIYINQKFPVFRWISYRKFYPILIIMFLACMYFIFQDIKQYKLPIYYISLLSLIVSFYLITKSYVQEIRS